MNTPTDFLEGIHSSLEKLPEDIAALVNLERPNLPDFAMSAGIDMGPADIETPVLQTYQDMPDYPSQLPYSVTSAEMPSYPDQSSYALMEAEFPSMDSPVLGEGTETGFPDLAGFSMAAQSMPDTQRAEYDTDQLMLGHLEDISRGITNLSRGGGSAANGFQRSTGPQQIPGRSVYIRDKDDPSGIPNRTILSHRFEQGN